MPHFSYIFVCFPYILILIFTRCKVAMREYSIPYQIVDDCLPVPGEYVHQFYDFSHLACRQCSQNSTHQTTRQSDGLACVCQENYRLTKHFGGAEIKCEPCASGETVSSDGWKCIDCNTTQDPPDVCPPCPSPRAIIAVERNLEGLWPVGGIPSRICKPCFLETHPNLENRCIRCNQVLSMKMLDWTCDCTGRETGGLCFNSTGDLEPEYPELYRIIYDTGAVVQISTLLREHIRAVHGICAVQYSNLTACQALGNLCTLLMYTRLNQLPHNNLCGSNMYLCNDACSLYLRVKDTQATGNQDWPQNMPWLYYFQESADKVLSDDAIPVTLGRNSVIKLLLAQYSWSGSFVGYTYANDGLLQLCETDHHVMVAAFTFGNKYSLQCKIPVQHFWDKYQTVFYDMYLEYIHNGKTQLYPIPVLMRNYKDRRSVYVNKGSDRTKWQLVRRFFLVDNISGNDTTNPSARVQVVRYPQQMTLHVELQKQTTNGQIYPPYLEIEYGQITADQYATDNSVQVQFGVEYKMNMDTHNRDISIATGVLCGFAVLYAALRALTWIRRAGKVAVDVMGLIKFLIYTCGTLANTFFVVILGWTTWWFIFYKWQSYVVLIPSEEANYTFRAYLGTAFALKCLQIIHIIGWQAMVDIFFVDWERPQKGATGPSVPANTQRGTRYPKQSVSIWRTYFVANEWSEIQTERRINPYIQILVVVLLLEFVGFKNMTGFDSKVGLNIGNQEYRSDPTVFFRFTVGVLVYVIVAFAQWLFYTFIYARFKRHPIQEFVDLCSMCNISVFIMSHDLYGYYIHGRSVYGNVDVGLREMYENLEKETENLMGDRGLIPGTEQQTFQVAIPKKLRAEYNKVLLTVTLKQTRRGAQRHASTGRQLDSDTELFLEAYGILNRFLQSFIEHSLQGIDYMVKDKRLMEHIMDTEFDDSSEVGIFYNDSGHSFDYVLFFGHETSLQIFEMLFFALVDLVSQNYILAGVLVFLLDQFLYRLRNTLGERNIAKKTMVDHRFLI